MSMSVKIINWISASQEEFTQTKAGKFVQIAAKSLYMGAQTTGNALYAAADKIYSAFSSKFFGTEPVLATPVPSRRFTQIVQRALHAGVEASGEVIEPIAVRLAEPIVTKACEFTENSIASLIPTNAGNVVGVVVGASFLASSKVIVPEVIHFSNTQVKQASKASSNLVTDASEKCSTYFSC